MRKDFLSVATVRRLALNHACVSARFDAGLRVSEMRPTVRGFCFALTTAVSLR